MNKRQSQRDKKRNAETALAANLITDKEINSSSVPIAKQPPKPKGQGGVSLLLPSSNPSNIVSSSLSSLSSSSVSSEFGDKSKPMSVREYTLGSTSIKKTKSEGTPEKVLADVFRICVEYIKSSPLPQGEHFLKIINTELCIDLETPEPAASDREQRAKKTKERNWISVKIIYDQISEFIRGWQGFAIHATQKEIVNYIIRRAVSDSIKKGVTKDKFDLSTQLLMSLSTKGLSDIMQLIGFLQAYSKILIKSRYQETSQSLRLTPTDKIDKMINHIPSGWFISSDGLALSGFSWITSRVEIPMFLCVYPKKLKSAATQYIGCQQGYMAAFQYLFCNEFDENDDEFESLLAKSKCAEIYIQILAAKQKFNTTIIKSSGIDPEIMFTNNYGVTKIIEELMDMTDAILKTKDILFPLGESAETITTLNFIRQLQGSHINLLNDNYIPEEIINKIKNILEKKTELSLLYTKYLTLIENLSLIFHTSSSSISGGNDNIIKLNNLYELLSTRGIDQEFSKESQIVSMHVQAIYIQTINPDLNEYVEAQMSNVFEGAVMFGLFDQCYGHDQKMESLSRNVLPFIVENALNQRCKKEMNMLMNEIIQKYNQTTGKDYADKDKDIVFDTLQSCTISVILNRSRSVTFCGLDNNFTSCFSLDRNLITSDDNSQFALRDPDSLWFKDPLHHGLKLELCDFSVGVPISISYRSYLKNYISNLSKKTKMSVTNQKFKQMLINSKVIKIVKVLITPAGIFDGAAAPLAFSENYLVPISLRIDLLDGSSSVSVSSVSASSVSEQTLEILTSANDNAFRGDEAFIEQLIGTRKLYLYELISGLDEDDQTIIMSLEGNNFFQPIIDELSKAFNFNTQGNISLNKKHYILFLTTFKKQLEQLKSAAMSDEEIEYYQTLLDYFGINIPSKEIEKQNAQILIPKFNKIMETIMILYCRTWMTRNGETALIELKKSAITIQEDGSVRSMEVINTSEEETAKLNAQTVQLPSIMTPLMPSKTYGFVDPKFNELINVMENCIRDIRVIESQVVATGIEAEPFVKNTLSSSERERIKYYSIGNSSNLESSASSASGSFVTTPDTSNSKNISEIFPASIGQMDTLINTGNAQDKQMYPDHYTGNKDELKIFYELKDGKSVLKRVYVTQYKKLLNEDNSDFLDEINVTFDGVNTSITINTDMLNDINPNTNTSYSNFFTENGTYKRGSARITENASPVRSTALGMESSSDSEVEPYSDSQKDLNGGKSRKHIKVKHHKKSRRLQNNLNKQDGVNMTRKNVRIYNPKRTRKQ
jgi:hypothetical protein